MMSRLLRHGLAVAASIGLFITAALVAAGVAVRPPVSAGGAEWLEPDRGAPTELPPGPSPSPKVVETTMRSVLVPPAGFADIKVAGAWLLGWAYLDRHTGRITGSSNAATMSNTMESMIKPWLAADYLRRLDEDGQQPTQQALEELRLMIVDSHDPMAEKYYRIGGSDSAINRLASICELKSVKLKTTLWSFTLMSPEDVARYGQCLADGRAAGAQWTDWLLDAMKDVRGGIDDQISGAVQGGRWGIIDGLPKEFAKDVAIKNGWTSYLDGWHINCLAVHPDWTLGVMMRTTKGLAAGADVCEAVAASLVVQPASG